MENIIAAISTIGGTIDNASILPKYKILLFGFTLSLTLFDVVTDTIFLVDVTQDFQQFSRLLQNYRNRFNFTSKKFVGTKTFCSANYKAFNLFYKMRIGLSIYYMFYALSLVMAMVSILYLYTSIFRRPKAKFSRKLLGIGQLLEFLPIIIEDMPEAFLTVYFLNVFDNPAGMDCLYCAINSKCKDRAPVGLRTHTATLIRFIGIAVHAFLFFALKARELYNQSLEEHAEDKQKTLYQNAKSYYCFCPCYVLYYGCCIQPSGNSGCGKCRYYFLLIINMLLAGVLSVWMVFLPVFIGYMFYPVYIPFIINIANFNRARLTSFLLIASITSGICWGILAVIACIYLWRHMYNLPKAIGTFFLSIICLPAFVPFASYIVLRDIHYNSRHCGKEQAAVATDDETVDKSKVELQLVNDQLESEQPIEYTYNNLKTADHADSMTYSNSSYALLSKEQ
ncbi:uncharacterized protein TRIADDRAFT_62606 [Trichoplax adhaerens]|uniref:Uncharacterized protein n=1 Tax=Trichoplax adhaerens TaxID=10228 RepID=B3SEA8_TRIAD|nr:predicted protein [Trichoplax adhaerens]EDV18936.1 predicted protein [Trichoplax adhaerens]|eukprot:XP_002118577.1 predicted protein [Trichoplax adhaerens]